MRRIEYKVALDGEPFTVANCDIARSYSKEDNHPLPIRMSILRCSDTEDKVTSIVHAASLNSQGVSVEFAEHYVDILLGKPSDWVLAQFQIRASCVELEYHHPLTNDVENIMLTVNGDPVEFLRLEFEVPHQDNRPDTKYLVEMRCENSSRNTAFIAEELPSTHRRTFFSLRSDEPSEMSITEYVDL